ncbi:MAG: glycosyltransferase family 2 protein [Promethearchaeota archaeon]|nr:MAG: glycosyltransferase family 2 protein [Candidatus Lokiarchaeota archaeon]
MGKKLYIVYGSIIIGIFAVIHLLFPTEWSTWITWTNEMFRGTLPGHIGLFIPAAFFFFIFVVLWGINFLASFGKFKYPPGSENYTPPISVVIPALNEEKVIGDTLESYHLSAYPKDKLELVVVASGSTDKTIEICEQYQKHLNIKIVTEPQTKKGKPAALNLGLKHASNDILCIYDVDNHVKPNTLNALIRPLYDTNIDVTLGPSQIRNRNINCWTKAVFIDNAYFCAMGLFFEIRSRLGRNLWILGRNYAIRRKVLEEFGGWKDDALAEDLHLSVQLSKAKKKFFHVPEAMSLELTPTTWESIKLQRKRWIGGYKQNMDAAMQLDKRTVILRNFGMLHYGHIVNYSVGAIVAAIIFGLIGDFYVMIICLAIFVIIFGTLVNAIRKYGDGRYRHLLSYPWYFVLIFFMFAAQFMNLENLDWYKTEK